MGFIDDDNKRNADLLEKYLTNNFGMTSTDENKKWFEIFLIFIYLFFFEFVKNPDKIFSEDIL